MIRARSRRRPQPPQFTRDQANFWIFAIFLCVVFLMGGGSRADILSQPIVRILSVIVLAIWAFQIRSDELRSARAPLQFLAVATIVMVLQLIPLPPSLWSALAGREIFQEGFAIAGVEPVWRPLTLTPDRTLNSLLAMLPPVATAGALAVLGRSYWPRLAPLLVALILLSAVFAVVQISTGALYLYRITNEGAAVGLFANRNHQALLLALAFPLLGYFATEEQADRGRKGLRAWVAGMIAVLLVPMLLVTGSRAGLFLGLAGGLSAFAIAARRKGHHVRRARTLSRLSLAVPILIMVAASVATVFLSRDLSLQRLSGESVATETRAQNLGTYVQMARDFMPFGTGFGAFDPVYRIYEPHEALRPTYMNQAHNDLAQLVIEAGAVGLLLAAAFVIWVVFRSWHIWVRDRSSGSRGLGEAGSAMVILILLASLFDYPLRTPIIACVMVVAVFFMMAERAVVASATSSLEPSVASSNSARIPIQRIEYES